MSAAPVPRLKRIMCVDDERDILDVAQLCLETVSGFEVKTCTSGQEALTKVEAFAPDLILLDVMMPGMNGPETLADLRKKVALNGVPIVFMTARIQSSEIKAYLKLGAAGVIPKPFDPMALSSDVERIWEECHEPSGEK
jgi:two-component system, OmpR family, response regulator